MENLGNENDQVVELKVGIHKKFMELRSALLMREKLLYRQLEVVASTKQHFSGCGVEKNILFKSRSNEAYDIQIIFENEAELLRSIRSFGRFQLGSMVLALKQEDYITPNCDHEIMYKNIQSDENQCNLLPQQKRVSDFILVDFSKDKSLIEHNVKYINDSIVNITLEEAKELIRRAHVLNESTIPQLNLEELDDDLESPIVEAVSNLSRDTYTNKSETTSSITSISDQSSIKRTKVVRTKPKVTINNCNGIINLRNISSVTINCSNKKCDHFEKMNVHEHKNMTDISELSTSGSFNTSSNPSNISNPRPHSKKTKKFEINAENHIKTKKNPNEHLHNVSTVPINGHLAFPFDGNERANSAAGGTEISSDFYSRLFNDIKRNLGQKESTIDIGILRKTLPPHSQKRVTEKNNPDTVLLEQTSQTEPQLVLKKFENLNIFLKNDRHNDPISSVHIEHWLSEIIKETDLEPMQNNEILEHSNLK